MSMPDKFSEIVNSMRIQCDKCVRNSELPGNSTATKVKCQSGDVLSKRSSCPTTAWDDASMWCAPPVMPACQCRPEPRQSRSRENVESRIMLVVPQTTRTPYVPPSPSMARSSKRRRGAGCSEFGLPHQFTRRQTSGLCATTRFVDG